MPTPSFTARALRAILLAAIAIAAPPAAAATRYVDAANTSGAEDGTEAAPFASIQRAIDAAVAGDVVSVAPGLYYENVTLKDLVDVVSQRGWASTVIDGRGGYVVGSWFQEGTVRATVDGFTIRNGSTLVHGVTTWYVAGYTQITVRNSLIRDGGMGVRASIKSSFTFENVVFYNTGQAISSIWGSGPALRNVTIDKADTAVWSCQTGVLLQNTSVTNATSVFTATYSGYIYGSHNNFFGYGSFAADNVYVALTDSLSVDPLFVNPPDDYRLAPGSPLVDAGVDVGLPYQGAAPDIGAFESPSSPAQQVTALAASVADAPAGTFVGPEAQRRNALYNKLMAVLGMLESIRSDASAAEKRAILTSVADKLRKDILAKADGWFGGNPSNDWITSQAEQAEFYPRVLQLVQAVEAELAALP